MGREEIKERMGYVLQGRYLSKAGVSYNVDGEIVIRVDLHGMSKNIAQKTLNNLIVLFRFPFVIQVVHGYNNGIAIKSMISHELNNSKIVEKRSLPENPGVTYLKIA